ncbi:hypothetical protein MRX96_040461 [Rhipicephalus microplus]
MSTAVATKRRRWKPQDASTLRDPTSDASSSRLSNRQVNLPELFALLTTQPPNADQGYKRRCDDIAEYATQTPDLGAFQTIGFSEVSHRRIGVCKIGAKPLLSTNYDRSERENCNASLYDVFTGEDRVIVVEKPKWKIPTESDTVVRNASGVLPENGWPRDLLVPTGTGMIGPEIYDLVVIEYRFSRQARKIPQGVLAAVTLRSRSEILLVVRISRGSYQHSDGEEYDCLDRSRPCSKDTDRTYLEADDDGTLRTASWSSRCGGVRERKKHRLLVGMPSRPWSKHAMPAPSDCKKGTVSSPTPESGQRTRDVHIANLNERQEALSRGRGRLAVSCFAGQVTALQRTVRRRCATKLNTATITTKGDAYRHTKKNRRR